MSTLFCRLGTLSIVGDISIPEELNVYIGMERNEYRDIYLKSRGVSSVRVRLKCIMFYRNASCYEYPGRRRFEVRVRAWMNSL